MDCICTLYKYILSTRNCVVIFTCWPKKYKFILQKLSILTFSRHCKGQMKVICQKTNQNFIIVLLHCSCITKTNKWSENDLSELKVNITWDQIRTWSEKAYCWKCGKMQVRKSTLVSVWHLIGWEGDKSFSDHSREEVKWKKRDNPRLLSTSDW